VDIAGETRGNLNIANSDRNASYSARMLTTDGRTVQSCPRTLTAQAQNALSVYPNPTNGEVRLSGGEIAAGDVISIFTLTGTMILQQTAEGASPTLDLSALPKGTYIAKVNGKAVTILKIR